MTIRSTRLYQGPNVWAFKPLVHMVIDLGDLEEHPSDALEGFTDALLEAIPTLWEHKCSVGQHGGFVQRLRTGTWMGHIAEHVALELQTLAGNPVKFGKTRGTDEPGVYNMVYEYVEENVGIAAGRLAIELVGALAEGRSFDLAPRLADLASMVEELAFGPSTQSILNEAKIRKIPVIRLNDANLVQLGYGRWQQRIQATTTSLTRMISVDIACDKNLTKRLLADIGIPVPQGAVVRSLAEALEQAAEIGYPLVTKPLDFSHGRGISLDIRTPEALEKAFQAASSYTRDVILEPYITGRDYRVLVVNDNVIAVAERVPAHVVGDGTHTVTELIDLLNADPRRGVGHEKVLTRVKIDDETMRLLGEQNLTLTSVPAAEQMVMLKATANISTGGTAIDRTDEALFENIEMARRAARVIGLDVAGIDIICKDIRTSIADTGGAIIEVNAAPGFRMHVAPSEGKPRDVAGPVVDMLFPPGTPFRVPILSVTGTNGKTTTARMCAHILKMAGQKVGLTTTDGIYIDGNLVRRGDMTGPWSARMVLKDPSIDVAVLETARGGILRSGLGFDRSNIGAVLNVSDDHLGLGGINTVDELANVKSLVIEVVLPGGWGVLNAEDHRCVAMAERCDGKVAWFSYDPGNALFRGHVESDGKGATYEQQTIVLHDGRKRMPVVNVVEVPATYGGTSSANIKNALAAALMCHLAGVAIEDIRQGLQTFDASFHLTPGRMNLVDVKGFRVLLDYAHNAAAFEEMASFVRAFHKQRSIGVIAGPGDRQNSALTRLGELAGAIFDVLIIKEDDNRRGRAPGETASILEAGVRAGRAAAGRETTDENLRIIPVEPEAVDCALKLGRRDDLVVILGDDLLRCWEQISAARRG
ncbi:MAG: cyanophycin synthetase [Proteobacteria bacterium]|nr:cyanophycin synthetase [Pseudomonadota bacterium]